MWTEAKAPSLAEMEAMAHEVFERLPKDFRALCEGVILRVDDFPTDEVLEEMQAETEFDLLGLFQGTGLPQQSHGDIARLPNMIWLYRRPIPHLTGKRSMEKFTTLEGVAAPLKIINVDTDMIIPKQYLKTIKRTGLGKGLFSEQRYKDDGSENPDFILNKPAYRNSKVLVAGDNFGCGSSREHAPWALLDFGIRCVISTSFGDIFYNNCFKNGILPIRVTQEDLDKLFDDAERGANATLTVDLAAQEIRGPDGGTVKFEIDPFRKHCLMNGLDDIGLTMEKKASIDAYEAKAKTARTWA